eukprot:TRINITY_DN689_c0_g1_i1.p1 TRINITY_DN689_c0_g1~~TRINITY_DN689_c0_g1_i1.p1  ORF type:complete len:238 (+),score=50.46 TRINITY_DN689_c0_g1_i1:44-715(+)
MKVIFVIFCLFFLAIISCKNLSVAPNLPKIPSAFITYYTSMNLLNNASQTINFYYNYNTQQTLEIGSSYQLTDCVKNNQVSYSPSSNTCNVSCYGGYAHCGSKGNGCACAINDISNFLQNSSLIGKCNPDYGSDGNLWNVTTFQSDYSITYCESLQVPIYLTVKTENSAFMFLFIDWRPVVPNPSYFATPSYCCGTNSTLKGEKKSNGVPTLYQLMSLKNKWN